MRGERFFPRFGLMIAGLLVWAAHFTVAYGFAALVCAGRVGERGADGRALVTAVVVGATVVALAAIALAALVAVGRWRRRDDRDRPADGFTATMTWLVGAAGAVSVMLTAMSAVLTPICGPTAF